jgi:hypothetical protein
VRRIALAEDGQGLFESGLLDEAVTGKIAAGRITADEILLGEERLRTCVVASRKVDLGQPEGIVVVIWERSHALAGLRRLQDLPLVDRLVMARSLSPIKMADSYCALLRASCLHSRRNSCIL